MPWRSTKAGTWDRSSLCTSSYQELTIWEQLCRKPVSWTWVSNVPWQQRWPGAPQAAWARGQPAGQGNTPFSSSEYWWEHGQAALSARNLSTWKALPYCSKSTKPGAGWTAADDIQEVEWIHLLSLKNRRDFTAVFQQWMGGYGGDRARFFSDVHGRRTRGSRHKLQKKKFQQSIHKENITMSVDNAGTSCPETLWYLQPCR